MDHTSKVYVVINGVEVEVDTTLLDAHGMYLGVMLDGPLQGYEVRLSQCDVSESIGARSHA